MVVIVDVHGNCFVECRQVFVLSQVADFAFEATKPALHVAVLPGAGFSAGTQLDLHFVAEVLVLVTQIL